MYSQYTSPQDNGPSSYRVNKPIPSTTTKGIPPPVVVTPWLVNHLTYASPPICCLSIITWPTPHHPIISSVSSKNPGSSRHDKQWTHHNISGVLALVNGIPKEKLCIEYPLLTDYWPCHRSKRNFKCAMVVCRQHWYRDTRQDLHQSSTHVLVSKATEQKLE